MIRFFRTPWQLWPLPAIYGPLLPWFLWQMASCSVWRCIGLAGVLRAAPPIGGEACWEFRKANIYRVFRGCEGAIPITLVCHPHPRGEQLSDQLRRDGVTFPLVAKPNLGTMSMGIRRFQDQDELEVFLRKRPIDYVLQPYVGDPREFAIFYYRFPDAQSGHILDLTERVLPEVAGDGLHTVDELIQLRSEWQGLVGNITTHYRGALDEVPAAGTMIRLAPAASGSRGAVFRDSRRLVTPQLTSFIDRLSLSTGFLFGKFDIKVPNVEDLQAGRALKILEINPVGAEINYIYDRNCSYRVALREIRRQYTIALQIAVAARNLSPQPPTLSSMVKKTWGLYQSCQRITECERMAEGR